MAIYIPIRKLGDTGDSVEYSFNASDGSTSSNGDIGVLRINKQSGCVSLIKPAPSDNPQNFAYSRAARKIKKHWAAGEYPDQTCWAS